MKRFFKPKYPKILALIFFIVIAYLVFKNPVIQEYVANLGDLSYFGIFFAGVLFSFGFSSPLAAGFFIILNPDNILLASIVGGIGSMFGNLLIFKTIKVSFNDEFENLKNERIIKKFEEWIEKDFGTTLTHYLIYAAAGFMLASPLPDEFGMIMLAGLTRIKASVLAIISFILHTVGIMILLYI